MVLNAYSKKIKYLSYSYRMLLDDGAIAILQEDVKDWSLDVFTNALTRAEETAKRGSV